MAKFLLAFFTICFAHAVQAQELINMPSGDEAQSIGYAVFDGAELANNRIAADSVHATLSVNGNDNLSYLTCITTESKRVNLSYLTTRVQIANKNLLGNFSFESFEVCKVVAMKMADSIGRKVRFKVALDSAGANGGKVVSVEWLME